VPVQCEQYARSVRSAPAHAPRLAVFRYGVSDPTTRLDRTTFARASLTPDGEATLRVDFGGAVPTYEAWGPGAGWMLQQAPAMLGADDPGHLFDDGHPVVLAAQRNHGHLRIGASGLLYHELLPTILGQRITAGEALAQWARLVRELGSPAPGPIDGLLLPPRPAELVGRPAWWYHRLGIEARRADTLRTVARHADKLFRWAALPTPEVRRLAGLLPGVGEWTIGCVLGTALGDPDAVAVGDYHLKNVVTHALTGRPRGSDEEMLALLQPYAGQRGRVVIWLLADGHQAPAFGPRQRILPMRRW